MLTIESLWASDEGPAEWDYIVVGAGSAGCVLANRLSEDAGARVLVVEAGGGDTSPFIRIPVGMLQISSRYAWNYVAEPDPSRLGVQNTWLGGKVLGGSSSINGQVWTRGDPADFDEWAALGCKGWEYAAVLPYFKRIEHFAGGGDDHRGGRGPLHVSFAGVQHRLTDAFVEAAQQASHPFNRDLNGSGQGGVGYSQVSQRRGWRHSTARAYLAPARRRRNLTVVKHAVATRVLLEDGCASGIEYRWRGGAPVWATARRGVILSAGAIESPKLLQLSGIGPADELRRLGIDVVVDSPGVGRNLQEHPVVGMAVGVNVPSLNMELTVAGVVRHGLDFVLRGKGGATAPPAHAFVFAALAAGGVGQDYELQFAPYGMTASTTTKRRKRLHGDLAPMKEPVARLGVWSCHPTSRGTVTLASSDPNHQAVIRHELLSSEDIAVLTAAGRRAREILAAPAFRCYVTEELAPGSAVETDAEWEAYLRRATGRGFHQVGTCRMGTDLDAVVSPDLDVRGVDNLYVVDASVMPTLVSGHTNAATVMIAERAADLIRGRAF